MVRGYHAPADTPDDVIAVLEAAFKKVVESEEYEKFLADQFSNAYFLDSKAWSEQCEEELQYFPKVMEKAGVTVS